MKLHISSDEKVIDRCIKSFEKVFPGQNKFIILIKKNELPRFVKNKNAIFAQYGSKEFWHEVGDTQQYDAIILHSFNIGFARFVKKIKHKNIYWIEWGADLYVKMLAPRGYQLFYEKDTDWRFSHLRMPKIVYKCVKMLYGKYYLSQVVPALKHVKYFVPDSMEDEYALLLSYYPELNHLKYANFYYYPIDEVVQKNVMGTGLGDNIVVGNSASVSGNHKEAFELLSRFNLSVNVIVPLSYGNMKYATYIKDCGQKMLGNLFMPITDYLPLQEYNKLLSSANIFIYPNYRQEGVGNILASLYLGGKVFLNKKNPLLLFYKKLGLYIYDMDELNEESIKQHLPQEKIIHNRNVLMMNYSKELQLELIKKNF